MEENHNRKGSNYLEYSKRGDIFLLPSPLLFHPSSIFFFFFGKEENPHSTAVTTTTTPPLQLQLLKHLLLRGIE